MLQVKVLFAKETFKHLLWAWTGADAYANRLSPKASVWLRLSSFSQPMNHSSWSAIECTEDSCSVNPLHMLWLFPPILPLCLLKFTSFSCFAAHKHTVFFFHSVNLVLYAHSKLRYSTQQLGHCNSFQDSLGDLGRVRERKSIHVECSCSSFSRIKFDFLLILPVFSGISGNWPRLPQTSVLTGQLWG